MKPTCLDCKERHPGCHGSCERYQAYRQWLDKRKSQQNQGKTYKSYLGQNIFRNNRGQR